MILRVEAAAGVGSDARALPRFGRWPEGAEDCAVAGAGAAVIARSSREDAEDRAVAGAGAAASASSRPPRPPHLPRPPRPPRPPHSRSRASALAGPRAASGARAVLSRAAWNT